jgi:hypothetical protein
MFDALKNPTLAQVALHAKFGAAWQFLDKC